MANYLDAVRVLDRQPRRFIYLCGKERVLVEDLVDRIRTSSDALSMNRVSLVAGRDNTGDIWSEMSQYPLPGQTRLVVVRNAEKLKGWEYFDAWMVGSKGVPIQVVMVAEEPAWPMDRNKTARERMVRSTQALYVECTLARDTAVEMATRIVMEWSEEFRFDARPRRKRNAKRDIYLSDSARYLVERTGVDLARCRDVARWVSLMKIGQTPPKKLLDILTTTSALNDFVDALMHLDKPQAATLVPEVQDRSRVIINILAQRLIEAEKVNRSMKHALNKCGADADAAILETAKVASLPYYSVKKLWEVAGHYDASNLQKRALLLAAVDEHAGDEGALAVLVAQW